MADLPHIPSVSDFSLVQVVRINAGASDTRWVMLSSVPRESHDLWLPYDPCRHVFLSDSLQQNLGAVWNFDLVPIKARTAVCNARPASWGFHVSDTAFDNAYDPDAARKLDDRVRAKSCDATGEYEAFDSDAGAKARFLDNALLSAYMAACESVAGGRPTTNAPTADEWVCCVVIVES